jgi:hypothetical protein
VSRPRARGWALAATLAGVALVLGVLVVPFLVRDRPLPASIPQPSPLFAVNFVELPPGERACLRPITIDPHSEVAVLKVTTFGAPAVPFTLDVRAAGYRAGGTSPAGYADGVPVGVPLAPPRGTVRGAACVRNAGDRRIALYGAGDRTRTAAGTFVAGRRLDVNFQLAFYERAPASVADRWPTIAERLATFRPVAPWVVWVVAALLLLGVPAALVGAVVLSSSGEERG